MAANLGSMVATVSARTKPFEQGMKRAGGNMQQFGTSTKKVNDDLKKMAQAAIAAIGSFVGFGKLKSMISEVSQEMDKLTKTARGLGISAQELARLEFASGIMGVDPSTLTKGLQQLQKTILDANTGLATARRAFQMIGVSLDDLAQMSPDEQFIKIMDALSQIEDAGLRSALAMQIFGSRTGRELANMAAVGTDGLQGLFNEFDNLHGVITDEMTDANENWRDSILRLETSWNGMKTVLSTTLIEIINPLVDKLTAAVAVFNNLDGETKAWVFTLTIVTPMVMALVVVLNASLIPALRGVFTLLKSIGAFTLKHPIAAAVILATTWGFSAMAADKMKEVLKELTAAYDEHVEGLMKNNNAAGDFMKNMEKQQQLLTKADGLMQGFKTPEMVFEDTVTELIELLTTVNEITGDKFIDLTTFNKGLAQAIQQLVSAHDISKQIQQTLQGVEAVALGTMAEVRARLAANRQATAQQQHQAHVIRLQQQAVQLLQQIANNTGVQLPVVNLIP